MSIIIADSEMPEGMPPMPMHGDKIDTAQIIREMRLEAQVQLGKTLEQAMRYGDQLAKGLLEQLKGEVARLNRPKVMIVEIEKTQRQLKAPASKYLPRLLVNAKLGLNSMLVGPAGCGKTFVAGQLAEALGLPFSFDSFTAGASEAWFLGRHTPTGFIPADFVERFHKGGVYLGDEFDAADPNTIMLFQTALANGMLKNPMDGKTYKRHPDFVFIAACNTVGKGGDRVYTARNALDGSSLTRFVRIRMDYCPEVDRQLCPDDALRGQLTKAREKLRELKSTEVISSRCMSHAYLQKSAGVSVPEILESLTLGWPIELVKQCGLDAEVKVEEAPKAAAEKTSKSKEPKKEPKIVDEVEGIF